MDRFASMIVLRNTCAVVKLGDLGGRSLVTRIYHICQPYLLSSTGLEGAIV